MGRLAYKPFCCNTVLKDTSVLHNRSEGLIDQDEDVGVRSDVKAEGPGSERGPVGHYS